MISRPARPDAHGGSISASTCRRGRVEDLLRGVEAETVEMKFVDPVAGIGDDELAHRRGIRAVEVDRLAPFVFVSIGEVVVGELREVVAVRAEVVVDHVENHTESRRDARDRRNGESHPARRRAASAQRGPRRRSPSRIDPVKSATGMTSKHRDARAPPGFPELACGRLPGSLPRKRADMHFVDDLAGEMDAAPIVVGPNKSRRDRRFATGPAAPPAENARPDPDRLFRHRADIDTAFPAPHRIAGRKKTQYHPARARKQLRIVRRQPALEGSPLVFGAAPRLGNGLRPRPEPPRPPASAAMGLWVFSWKHFRDLSPRRISAALMREAPFIDDKV